MPTPPLDDVSSIQVHIEATCSGNGLTISVDEEDTLDVRTMLPWQAQDEDNIFDLLSNPVGLGGDSERGSIQEALSPSCLPSVVLPSFPEPQAYIRSKSEDVVASPEESSPASIPGVILLPTNGDMPVDIPYSVVAADVASVVSVDDELRSISPLLGRDECEAHAYHVEPCVSATFAPEWTTQRDEGMYRGAFDDDVEAQGSGAAHVSEDDKGSSGALQSLSALVRIILSVSFLICEHERHVLIVPVLRRSLQRGSGCVV